MKNAGCCCVGCWYPIKTTNELADLQRPLSCSVHRGLVHHCTTKSGVPSRCKMLDPDGETYPVLNCTQYSAALCIIKKPHQCVFLLGEGFSTRSSSGRHVWKHLRVCISASLRVAVSSTPQSERCTAVASGVGVGCLLACCFACCLRISPADVDR